MFGDGVNAKFIPESNKWMQILSAVKRMT